MTDELNPPAGQREATAAIRGYLYQFDASILAVLSSAEGDEVTVEGVEDYDVVTADTDTHSQVKYYEAQKLTDATVRDAILPMIEGFLRLPAEARKRKRYILYGHFKQAPKTAPAYSIQGIKSILASWSYVKDEKTGKKTKIKVNLQENLGASDQDLTEFCACFTICLSCSFEIHRAQVVAALQVALGVSQIEVEQFSYNSALTAMARLSIGRSEEARTTTRRAFLQKICRSTALYSIWAMREEGENAYCRKIREAHFARLNIDSRDRFFVISLPDTDGIEAMHSLVQHIVSRWSSHQISRKPNRERYAPILFFPGLASATLVALKTRLVQNGHQITDGYAFNGAVFTTRHLLLQQSTAFPVSARFVADLPQFEAALTVAARQGLVVQLHAGDPLEISAPVEHIAIPISNAAMAKKIV